MKLVKKTLAIFIFFIFSCESNNSIDLLHPIPILKIKLGEKKQFDISNYFKMDDIKLTAIGENASILLEGSILTIDGSSINIGFTQYSIMVNGQEITLIIECEKLVKHTFTLSDANAKNVVIMGAFNDWSHTALPMVKNGNIFSRIVYLEPKKHEYKFIIDGKEEIDPTNPIFISNNIGGWNSILDLTHLIDGDAGQLIKDKKSGNYLHFSFLPPSDGALPVHWIVLTNNTIMHADGYDPTPSSGLKINTHYLPDGLLRIIGLDTQGRKIAENRTIIKNQIPLTTDGENWHFDIIYNIMVDRFKDGEIGNNRSITDPKLHSLANFMGGDLDGINQKIKEGYFNQLNVSTLWISPIQTQPDSSWIEYVKPHRTFSGYHGYWPVEPREVDPRYGSSTQLKQMVDLSHDDDMKVLLDFVSNHVHQDHPYFKDHRDWFGQVTLPNGEINIRNWSDETRLTTWFDTFIPSFDFPSSPDAMNQIVGDAIWWMDEYNFDGFRQDAVKHVPHTFWKSLNNLIRQKFPNKSFYQIGETFGSDDLIRSYVNPSELDAQFNFGIYFNARGIFGSDESNFSDLGRIILENKKSFGPIHLMGNITSSHDQFRFSGYADGQIQFGEDGIARSFENPVGSIQKNSTYKKLANFHAFNVSQPGIPIIYYGEEIALMGEGDPGNRRMMKFNLNEKEQELKNTFSRLNSFRQSYPSLSLGDQIILKSDGPLFVTLKKYFNETIIFAVNQSSKSISTDISIPVPISHIGELGTDKTYELNENNLKVELPPYSHTFYVSQN